MSAKAIAIRPTRSGVFDINAATTRRSSERTVQLPDITERAGSMSPLDALRLLWQRKFLIAAIIAAGASIAAAIAFSLEPRYAASTQLLLDPRQQMPSMERNLALPFGLDRGNILSEIEILRSSALAEKVIDHLGLWTSPEFGAPGPREAGDAATAERGPMDWLRGLLAEYGGPGAASSETALQRRVATTEAFRRNITVRPLGSSFVVEVRYESRDPERAALIANTIAKIYIGEVIKAKQENALRRHDWLDERVTELRKRVLNSERAVADMILGRGIVEIGQVTVTDRQITEASAELMRARARRAEVMARLGMANQALIDGRGIEALTDVQSSGLVQRLREQETVVLRRIGELGSRFGERHPKMADARAELADLRQKIREETERIVQGLRNEHKVAEAQVDSLTAALAKLQEERARPVRDQVELRELEREAALSRKLYEDFLAKLNLAAQEGTLEESNAQVVSQAQPPVEPTSPHKPMIVGLGVVLSGVFAVCLILLAERLHTGFRTPDQIEEAAQLALLGAVPLVRRRSAESRRLADLVLDQENSGYAEAVRSLRTALSVSGPDDPPKVLLIASSLSGEGKTSLGIALARQAAQSAVSGGVILIDCDLRRPSVAAAVGLQCKLGLLDLFAGEAKLEDVIQEDTRTGLHIIPAIAGAPNPPELLNSLHMRELVQELTRRYELVILDSPALSSVSDARVLAKMADATIFVVQWEKTPRSVALTSLRQLRSAGADIAGVVLHKVSSRELGQYGYVGASS